MTFDVDFYMILEVVLERLFDDMFLMIFDALFSLPAGFLKCQKYCFS